MSEEDFSYKSAFPFRKKILFLSARLPLPLNTGAKIRSFHILKALCTIFDVTFVSFYGSKDEATYFNDLQLLGATVIPVLNQKIDLSIGFKDVISNIVHQEPVTVRKYWSSEMYSVVNTLVNEVDAVHCEHLHMAQYLPPHIEIPKILNAHNVESMVARRLCESETNFVKKKIYYHNYTKMCRFETSVVKTFAMVFTVSANDKEELRRMGAIARLEVVENGVDETYFKPATVKTDGSLVFVGSMDWLPNDDGMMDFLKEVYPALLARGRCLPLYIVGRNPSSRLIAKAKEFPLVTVTGTVEDVRPYIDRAAVYVVPLRFGGGTRLKILEAFAMKKPVVSTSLGCEGIEGIDGEHLLIADSKEGFVAAVEQLLDDSPLQVKLRQNAERLIQEKYSWSTIADKMIRYYREVLPPDLILN